MTETRSDSALALLILAIGAAFLFPLWARPGIVYSDHSDTIAMGGMPSRELRSLVQERRWPLWDSSANSGTPAHANPLAMYSFPFQWLNLFLPQDRATNLILLLNVLLAGLAMFVCARRYLERPASALFCGIAYMLSYRYLAMVDTAWTSAMSMYALAPLLLWAADRVLESPDPARTAPFAVILGLSAMQGSSQSFYYALLGLAAFVAWRASSVPRELRRRAALAVAGAGAIAVLLAAPDLLPRAQFAALSSRTNLNYRFFLDKMPRWSDLATLLGPRDAGGTRLEFWENNFYFGWWLYPLAAWGCAKDWRKCRAPLAALVVCVALCFDSPLLALLFRVLPGFGLFRKTTRLLQLAQLAGVLLAGVGVDALLKGSNRRREAVLAALLCLLPIADSGARVLPRLRTLPLSQAFPEPAFLELLRRSPTSGRVAAIGRTALPYGAGSYHGIDMINGYQPLNLKHYVEYFSILETGDPARIPRAPVVWTDLISIAKPDMLRALDAEFVVSDRPLPLESLGYGLVGRRDDVPVYALYRGLIRTPVYLWRDLHPLGPAYFAASVVPARGEEDSLSALAASTSALDARVFGWGGAPLDFAGGEARMTRRGENVYEYDLDSRGANFLILSQIWYPGWRARLDGKETRVYRTNHALIGCVVPPGRHALELEMTSPALEAGLALCALGLAAVAALLLRRAPPSSGKIA